MQYVKETGQELNISFATHRASIRRKLKSNSCKWLVEHFPIALCKNVKYTVQLIEKQQGSGRISCGAIDLDEAVRWRKKEAEWLLKLKIVYLHGLNENIDICEDDKDVIKLKSDDGIVRNLVVEESYHFPPQT